MTGVQASYLKTLSEEAGEEFDGELTNDAWPDVGPSVTPTTPAGVVDSILADTLRALAARTT